MKSRDCIIYKRRNRSGRRGFTLLEIILALSISLVMMLALFEALSMYYVQTEAGREIAERAQLERALVGKMQADLRMAFTDWEPAGGSAEDSESGYTSSSSSSELPPGGVLGYADSLTLVTRAMPMDIDYSSNTSFDSLDRKTDVRMIRYYLSQGETVPMGLVRESYDQIPDPMLGIDPSPARTDLLAEEIGEFLAQYYDGTDWVDAWDAEYGAAPLAIRIRLGFRPPRRRGEQQPDPAAPLTYHQFTMALPISQAAAASSQATEAAEGGSGL